MAGKFGKSQLGLLLMLLLAAGGLLHPFFHEHGSCGGTREIHAAACGIIHAACPICEGVLDPGELPVEAAPPDGPERFAGSTAYAESFCESDCRQSEARAPPLM